jgi:hypothetical protein
MEVDEMLANLFDVNLRGAYHAALKDGLAMYDSRDNTELFDVGRPLEHLVDDKNNTKKTSKGRVKGKRSAMVVSRPTHEAIADVKRRLISEIRALYVAHAASERRLLLAEGATQVKASEHEFTEVSQDLSQKTMELSSLLSYEVITNRVIPEMHADEKKRLAEELMEERAKLLVAKNKGSTAERAQSLFEEASQSLADIQTQWPGRYYYVVTDTPRMHRRQTGRD